VAIDRLEAMVMLRHEVRPPGWIESAPIRTAASVEIAAAPEAVWAVLADHEAWPRWFALLDRVEVTGAPTGVGGARRVIIQRLPFDEVFTVWDEPRQLAWAVTGSRLPLLSLMAESVRLEPAGAGCRLDLTQGLQARRGFGHVLGPMWRTNLPGIRQALDTLKAELEASQG
jgi:hypothetical protein